MINLINNVPDVYVNESRDFQLYLRLLNIIIGGTKFNIESITDIYDPKTCNNRVLNLLCTTFNFYPKIKFTDEDLRIILAGFGNLIRHKGTKKGIEQAVSLALKTQGLDTAAEVVPVTTLGGMPLFKIDINIYEEMDRSYLYELLEYVKPIGFVLQVNLITKEDALSEVYVQNKGTLRVNTPESSSQITLPEVDNNKIIQEVLDPEPMTEEDAYAWNEEHSIRFTEDGELIEIEPFKYLIEPGHLKYKPGYVTHRLESVSFDANSNQWSKLNKYVSVPETIDNSYLNSLNRAEITFAQDYDAQDYEDDITEVGE